MRVPADWTFQNREVAEAFDMHVREQLPWYEEVSGAVAHIARHYLRDDGTLIDLGASTGNIGRLLEPTIASRRVTYLPIDNSPQMGNVFAGPGELVVADAVTYDLPRFDVAVCMLVLMFLSQTEREGLLQKLQARVKTGGAIIVVDKMENFGGYFGSVMARLALAGKIAQGATPDDVIQKELSLAGSQRPMKQTEVPANGKQFFQFGEFFGFVVEG